MLTSASSPPSVSGGVGQRRPVRRVGHIAGDGDHLCLPGQFSQFSASGLQRLGATRVDQQRPAVAGELARQGQPQPARRPGDENGASGCCVHHRISCPGIAGRSESNLSPDIVRAHAMLPPRTMARPRPVLTDRRAHLVIRLRKQPRIGCTTREGRNAALWTRQPASCARRNLL